MDEDAPKPGWAMRLGTRAAQTRARWTRPLLMGVRAVLFDADGGVFLVRHSYTPGWHFPGGGVEVGETLLAALDRELAEEANIVLDAPPALHGVFFNRRFANRDHVVVYVARAFHQTATRKPDWEIVESGFFPVGSLPSGTSRSARARLAEIVGGAPVSPLW